MSAKFPRGEGGGQGSRVFFGRQSIFMSIVFFVFVFFWHALDCLFIPPLFV